MSVLLLLFSLHRLIEKFSIEDHSCPYYFQGGDPTYDPGRIVAQLLVADLWRSEGLSDVAGC